jgi:hypothetical protein
MNDKTMRKTVLLWMGILQMANGQSAIGKANAEHYTWGQRCDGWYFVKNDEMTVIEERMPPGTAETLQVHAKSRQFFYIAATFSNFHRWRSPLKLSLLPRERFRYPSHMSETFLSESIAILTRTPKELNDQLRNLPEPWVHSKDDPEHWSPFDCVGHLIHGEKTDWMPRVNIILKHGPAVAFTPFDRFAQLRDSQGKTIVDLLGEFANLRASNLPRHSSR